jgi:hypothetical protein
MSARDARTPYTQDQEVDDHVLAGRFFHREGMQGCKP